MMRVLSMAEALQQGKHDREPLGPNSPYMYHDSPKWQTMAKGGQEEKAYYIGIYKSLTELQKSIMNQHAIDIRKSSKERNSAWNRIEASQTYQLIKSSADLAFYFIVTWAGAPLQLMTRPMQMLYVTAYFGTVYGFLYVANIIFLLAHVFGVGKIIKVLSDKQGAGWSPINWLDINIFNRQKRVIENARDALSSDLDEFLIPRHEKAKADMVKLAHQKPLEFNVDLARTILLMCTIVYERDVSFVQKAASASISKTSAEDDPNEGTLFLLKSEEAMFRMASEWNLEFVSMADFRKLNGPFAGAFYDFENIGPSDNPFIVVVMKGTSPDDFTEWLTDCACKFEAAGDFLGDGLAHSGFYQALFPPRDSGARTLPYMRIVETIKLIARKAAIRTRERFGEEKKVNLFVGGHSLGAGIASLLYARFLESPEDLGDDVVLRDSYVFGTPRSCDFRLATRVEYNLNRPINNGRQLWRVANRAQSAIIGDIVTRVPPGFADQRAIRAGLQDGSYYAYAAIGIRVDLTPRALSPPFYSMTDVPIGHSAVVVKKHDEAENEFARSREASKFVWPQDIVQLSMWLTTVLAPIMHDHFPASYMDSLNKVQSKTTSGRKASGSSVNVKAQNMSSPRAPGVSQGGPGRDKAE